MKVIYSIVLIVIIFISCDSGPKNAIKLFLVDDDVFIVSVMEKKYIVYDYSDLSQVFEFNSRPYYMYRENGKYLFVFSEHGFFRIFNKNGEEIGIKIGGLITRIKNKIIAARNLNDKYLMVYTLPSGDSLKLGLEHKKISQYFNGVDHQYTILNYGGGEYQNKSVFYHIMKDSVYIYNEFLKNIAILKKDSVLSIDNKIFKLSIDNSSFVCLDSNNTLLTQSMLQSLVHFAKIDNDYLFLVKENNKLILYDRQKNCLDSLSFRTDHQYTICKNNSDYSIGYYISDDRNMYVQNKRSNIIQQVFFQNEFIANITKSADYYVLSNNNKQIVCRSLPIILDDKIYNIQNTFLMHIYNDGFTSLIDKELEIIAKFEGELIDIVSINKKKKVLYLYYKNYNSFIEEADM